MNPRQTMDELREQFLPHLQLGIACAKPATVESGQVSKQIEICAALVTELSNVITTNCGSQPTKQIVRSVTARKWEMKLNPYRNSLFVLKSAFCNQQFRFSADGFKQTPHLG
jgi:hypothetical protein